MERCRILDRVEEGLEQGVACRDNVVLRGDNDWAQRRQSHVFDLALLVWPVQVGQADVEALLQVRLYLILLHVRRELAESEDCFLGVRGFLFRLSGEIDLLLEDGQKGWHDFGMLVQEVWDHVLREFTNSEAASFPDKLARVSQAVDQQVSVQINLILDRVQ